LHVSIDTWHPNLPELPGCAFDAGRYPNFYFLHGSSSTPAILETASLLLGGCIDFCLVDGDHSYDAVLADSNNVLRHMNRGGVMLFHDSRDASVMGAIDEFLRLATNVRDCVD
jgi:cephalosporin hydroxylase